MSKVFRLSRRTVTHLGCRVVTWKFWRDGVDVEHVILWTDEETKLR